MNDWYNTNEHRSYPFIENHSDSLPTCEIVDCKFFILNTDNPKVWLASRGEDRVNNKNTYIFKNGDLEMKFEAPRDEEYKVVWKYEKDWYGFVVFGDTTAQLEPIS